MGVVGWYDEPAFHRSTRRLPKGWGHIRRAVLTRDNWHCVLCGKVGAEVDHIGHRDDHRLINLRTLCHDCHKARTVRQGSAAGNAARWSKGTKRRPSETHPGIVHGQ